MYINITTSKIYNGPQPVHGMMGYMYMYVTYLMIERTGRGERQAATGGRQAATGWTGGRQAATGWTGGRQAATGWTGGRQRQAGHEATQ